MLKQLRFAALSGVAIGVALSVFSSAVFAQDVDSGDIGLQPGDEAPASESPVSALPATEPPVFEPPVIERQSDDAPLSLFQSQKNGSGRGEGTKVLAAPPGREDGAVTSSDLDAVGMEIFGLLNPEEGGLGYDLWRGSSLRSITPVLAALPEPGPSPARQQLFSSLLLSRAYDPGGPAGDIPFITLRARQLFEAGQLRHVEMILDQTAEPPVDLASLQLLSELYLVTQRPRRACGIAARTRSVSTDPFWSRLRTLCYAMAEDRAAAQLGADLLAEQGYDDQLFYSAVANRIDGAGLSYDGLEVKDAVHFALLADGGPDSEDGFPEDVLNTRSSALRTASFLLSGVRGRGAEDLVNIQIPLAEEGVSNGSVLPVHLAILYGSVVLGDDEAVALIASEGKAKRSVRKAAAIYQAMSSAATPVDQAKLLKVAWDDAERYDRRALFTTLYSEVLLSLSIEPELDVFAIDFTKATLAAKAWNEAAEWLRLAWQIEDHEGREVGNGSDNETLKALSVALQIVAPDAAKSERGWNVAARLSEAFDGDDDSARRHAVLEVRLFEVFGGKIDGETRQVLAGYSPALRGRMPETGVLSGLDAAARAGRRGEVILLTLIALGDSKTAQVPIIVTSKCISALLRTGFMEDAKTLAIESLLADL